MSCITIAQIAMMGIGTCVLTATGEGRAASTGSVLAMEAGISGKDTGKLILRYPSLTNCWLAASFSRRR